MALGRDDSALECCGLSRVNKWCRSLCPAPSGQHSRHGVDGAGHRGDSRVARGADPSIWGISSHPSPISKARKDDVAVSADAKSAEIRQRSRLRLQSSQSGSRPPETGSFPDQPCRRSRRVARLLREVTAHGAWQTETSSKLSDSIRGGHRLAVSGWLARAGNFPVLRVAASSISRA